MLFTNPHEPFWELEQWKVEFRSILKMDAVSCPALFVSRSHHYIALNQDFPPTLACKETEQASSELGLKPQGCQR